MLVVLRDLNAGDEGEGADHQGVQHRHQGPLRHRDGREVAGEEERGFLERKELLSCSLNTHYYCHMAEIYPLFPCFNDSGSLVDTYS